MTTQPVPTQGEVERLAVRLKAHAVELRREEWDEEDGAAADVDAAARYLAALSPKETDRHDGQSEETGQ